MPLPDVNIWLALAFEAHVHHEPAKAWLGRVRESVFFCRLSQQGFLRIATNPKAFGAEAVSLAGAWRMYDSFLSDGRIAFHEEPAGLEAEWRGLTSGAAVSPKTWSDAYLAAFALSAGLQLVSFDRGLGRFDRLDISILS